MKNILKFLTFALFITAFVSCGDDDNNTPTTSDLTLNIVGLDVLGDDFVYEGWIMVNGNPITTGRFTSIDFPQIFSLDASNLAAATKFVLTIEPATDPSPEPSNTKILVGDFSENTASITTAIVGDFSDIIGNYILATPTDGAMTNENSGIWFLEIDNGSPIAGLTLPTLPEGWIYEGWAVINGTPVSTGTFSNVSATDNFDGFSGSEALGMPNGSDGFFPGEDFLVEAPMGLMFPTDLSGGKAVISIEPIPDNSTMPFTLKPLVGMIPNDATDHTVYGMDVNLDSLPTGTAIR